MFRTCTSAAGRSVQRPYLLHGLRQRSRNLWTEALHPVTEGFLDLSLAIPWPASFPPYASTIILTGVLTRLIFTLPLSIWAKNRQWRLENEVLPELMLYRKTTAVRIAKEMKIEGLARLGIEKFRAIHVDRLKRAMERRRKDLYVEHSCSPETTMFVPALSQLPLFVLGTATFSALTSQPSPLNDESFLTLTSLAHPDPTGVLPVALGLLTLANVETANWFIGSERALRNAQLEERRKQTDATLLEEGKAVRLRAKDVVQGSLRGLSVVRILIGAMVDGSVLVYWLSSATFGLFQSWAFNWWDARWVLHRKREDRHGQPSARTTS